MGASCKYNYSHPGVFEALGFGLMHIATCKADLLATDGIRQSMTMMTFVLASVQQQIFQFHAKHDQAKQELIRNSSQ